MQVDAQALAEHAARVADAAAAVDAVSHRDGMDKFPVAQAFPGQGSWIEDAAQVGVSDLVASDGNVVGDKPGRRIAGG